MSAPPQDVLVMGADVSLRFDAGFRSALDATRIAMLLHRGHCTGCCRTGLSRSANEGASTPGTLPVAWNILDHNLRSEPRASHRARRVAPDDGGLPPSCRPIVAAFPER